VTEQTNRYKRRTSSTIPFGWELVEGSTDLLEIVETEVELLEKAKEYLKGSSYREVAKWLSNRSGRDISHVTLYRMTKKDLSEKRKKAARIRWERAKAKARSETQEDLIAEAEAYRSKKSQESS
jgi:hypothetical protein|tara:strand:- start:133 stop:504 length:372 start_codon:yes stop_codon:yes gene_type:complete